MAYGAVAQMGERYTDKVEAVVRIYEVPQIKIKNNTSMKREEAIKVVRKLTKSTYFSGRELDGLRTLIPELCESEDERIRKDLIDIIKYAKDGAWMRLMEDKDKFIAYLEKQKEKDAIPDELVKCYKDFGEKIGDEGRALINAINAINQFSEQKEQKPAEWSEEDENVLNDIITAFHRIANGCEHYFSQDTAKEFERVLKSVRLQPNWKPSEEQMSALLHAMSKVSPATEDSAVLTDLYEQLKKL